MIIGLQFVNKLNRALNLRHVSEGAAMLGKGENAWAKLPPNHPHATALLLLIAQWVDVGYRGHDFLDSMLQKFPLESRRKLPLEDYLRVRMAEGFRAVGRGGRSGDRDV